MQFFTQLGIDWRLLVAQIINFVILIWLLSKFLYKPVLKQIQEDEEKRREVDEARQSIEKEKELLKQLAEQELAEAKKQSRKIIADAAKFAEDLKNQTSSEQRFLNEKLAQQLRQETALLTSLLEEKIIKKEQAVTLRKALDVLDKTLDNARKEEVEKMFFDRLISNIKKARLPQKQLTFPIRLEYAIALSPDDLLLLERVLCEKLHILQVKIEKKKNPLLISGVNLQVAGMFFSQNIFDTIQLTTLQT